MTDDKSSEPASYWHRRAKTLKNSFWKRYNKLTKLASGSPAMQELANDHYRKLALQMYEASQLKPTLKTGYIKRSERRLDAQRLGVKAIAFYLPQFHPIPENDAWWGKGFTEWNNVTRAMPQFLGHYQPRLPGDLGFYDLRLPEVMRQQIELARDYGIHGFCFHHYWFNGRRLLELPVQNLLKDKSLDINFCLCWANENWSRRWDGSEHEILMPQDHSPEDDLAFIDDLIPAFQDERYIRVDGKPVLIVYRASLFPDIAATAVRWRARVKERGLDGIYLVVARSLDSINPNEIGFDAAVEFPPNNCNTANIAYQQTIVNNDFVGAVYDYRELALRQGKVDSAEFVCHKTVMPSWDNCARKLSAASSFVNVTPGLYARWLDDALEVTLRRPPEQRLLFINAWNEWAEGAYLEPDRRYGYANLNATASVLSRTYRDPEVEAFIAEHNQSFEKRSEAVIVLHLYYEDLLSELSEKYLSQAKGADCLVTVRFDVSITVLRQLVALLPNVYLIQSENRGRDFYPFLLALQRVSAFGYATACKLHTKKSHHRQDGGRWRDQLMNSLLGHQQAVEIAEEVFAREPQTAILAPVASTHDLSDRDLHVGNIGWLDKMLALIDCQQYVGKYNFEFPAGSMFWFRVKALQPLLDLNLTAKDFEHETGQLDGTLAHTLERLIILIARKQGYSAREIDMAAQRRMGVVTAAKA